jgi:hypothetical protein
MRVELVEHGRMDNFRRLKGLSTAPQQGPVYSDSDIYKWLESVGFVLQSGDRPELRATAEGMIRDVVAVQEGSGYLNTYFQGDKAGLRMLPATRARDRTCRAAQAQRFVPTNGRTATKSNTVRSTARPASGRLYAVAGFAFGGKGSIGGWGEGFVKRTTTMASRKMGMQRTLPSGPTVPPE